MALVTRNKLNDRLQTAIEEAIVAQEKILDMPAEGLTVRQAAELSKVFAPRMQEKVYRFKLRCNMLHPDDPEFGLYDRRRTNRQAFNDGFKD